MLNFRILITENDDPSGNAIKRLCRECGCVDEFVDNNCVLLRNSMVEVRLKSMTAFVCPSLLFDAYAYLENTNINSTETNIFTTVTSKTIFDGFDYPIRGFNGFCDYSYLIG